MINNTINPKLSVIIPVYNVLHYLQEAVDSILMQSVKPHEIIIINDGSTDGSGELVEKLYGAHPLIKIIHTTNSGLGEARNVGTRAATGDYIYYFDSDDIAINGLIATFYETLNEHEDIDIFAFSAESFADTLVSPEDKVRSKSIRLISYRRNMEREFHSGEEAFAVLSEKKAFIPNAWLYIYARRLQLIHQLFFLPIIHEDEEFTPRLFFHAKKVYVTDKVFFSRRIRSGSIMQSSRTERNAIGYLRACDALEDLMKKSSSEESLKYLDMRICTNIINAIGVAKASNVTFTAKTRRDLDLLCERHSSFDIFLARKNFFLWRVFNFSLKKIKFR